jgi:hypothetical protein
MVPMLQNVTSIIYFNKGAFPSEVTLIMSKKNYNIGPRTNGFLTGCLLTILKDYTNSPFIEELPKYVST